MPELPEVEAARRMISEICLQSKIVTAKVREQGGGPRNDLFDDIIYEQEGSGNDESYEKAFVGKTIAQVYRKGKHLWVHMSGKPINSYILFHFGMTGSFVAKGIIFPTYKAFKVDDSQWPPRFTKLELVFENGIHLAFCDPRRLGRIRLCKGDPLTQAPSISKLATDPLLEVVNVDTASALLSKLTCPIKALLLDQEKLVCGVGNWVADEVLYQAKIHPSSPCNALPEPVVAALLHALQSVLKTAVEHNAASKQFPDEWLFHTRWSKKGNEKAQMMNGNWVSFETVGGRTSAIVLKIQKKYTAKVNGGQKVDKKIQGTKKETSIEKKNEKSDGEHASQRGKETAKRKRNPTNTETISGQKAPAQRKRIKMESSSDSLVEVKQETICVDTSDVGVVGRKKRTTPQRKKPDMSNKKKPSPQVRNVGNNVTGKKGMTSLGFKTEDGNRQLRRSSRHFQST